eukprot:g7144.t1
MHHLDDKDLKDKKQKETELKKPEFVEVDEYPLVDLNDWGELNEVDLEQESEEAGIADVSDEMLAQLELEADEREISRLKEMGVLVPKNGNFEGYRFLTTKKAPRAGEYHPDDRPPAQKAFGPGEHPPDYAPSGREAPRPGEHPPDYAPAEKEAEEKDPAKPTEKPIVLKLVAVNGLALQHAAEDLWEDPEVVRTKDGLALEFAAEELQRDPRVEQNAFAKKHAAKELHADRDLKKDDTEEPRAVKQSRNASNHAAAEELRNDRDFILQVVKQDPDVLQLVSEELQCDKGCADCPKGNRTLSSSEVWDDGIDGRGGGLGRRDG